MLTDLIFQNDLVSETQFRHEIILSNVLNVGLKCVLRNMVIIVLKESGYELCKKMSYGLAEYLLNNSYHQITSMFKSDVRVLNVILSMELFFSQQPVRF